ncbi:MAG: sugar phosphate isomerase/epimerase family protein [Planctomycetota bacterium]
MAKSKKQAKVEGSVRPPRMGVMSNLFRGDPEEIAHLLLNFRLESVQILPNFPSLRFATKEDITPQQCKRAAEPFLNAELVVAGISAHTNFVDPDKRRRKRMIQRFDALIECCQDFGTTYVVTETGTLNTDHPWEDYSDNHKPETLAAFIEALKPSAKLAKKAGVTILLEGYLYHVVSTVQEALHVREELGESIGFVMDPGNYFTRGMANSAKKHLKDIFTAIGPYAPIAHAKDVRYAGGELTTPRAGTGILDYKEFLELIDQFQPECPLIIEQIRPEELQETLDFIDRFFE